MPRFEDDLTTFKEQMEFGKFIKKTKPKLVVTFVIYGHIRKALGRPLAYPTPGNTYKKGPPLLTLEIIDGLHKNSKLTPLCPKVCKDAWAKVDQKVLTAGRGVARYEEILGQLQKQNVDIKPLTQSLSSVLKPLETVVDNIYVKNYADLERRKQKEEKVDRREKELDKERARRENIAKEIKKKMAEAPKKLKGHIKKVPFTYYKKLHIPNAKEDWGDLLAETNDVLVVGTGNTHYKEFCTGKAAVGIIVEKGTTTLGRNKYVKFKGITNQEMFNALKATGWQMKNLKKPADLEKVG